MNKILCLLYFLFFFFVQSKGQDLHYTQFNASPLTLNPALTGVFDYGFKDKNIRFVSNFRQQWKSIPSAYFAQSKPFNSTSFSLDGKIKGNRFLRKDFIGAGIIFYRDKAGDLGFGTNQVNFSVSYNKALDYAATQFFTIGIQSGFAKRFIDLTTGVFDNQWDKSTHSYDPSAQTGEINANRNFSYPDISFGMGYNYFTEGNVNFHSGIAIGHINKPMQNFFPYQDFSIQLYRKLTIHADALIKTKKNISILPSIMLLKQGPASEINIANYFKINSKNKFPAVSYQFGPGFRIVGNYLKPIASDAFTLTYKFTYNNIIAGISYDSNISTLKTATQTRGAFEISLIIYERIPINRRNYKFRNERKNCPKFQSL